MKALLPWDEAEEVTFECEPGTLTEASCRSSTISASRRLSLGIENFDDDILQINGRAHGVEGDRPRLSTSPAPSDFRRSIST